MEMFQDNKLSVGVDIWAFLATFSKNWAIFYSIFWSHWAEMTFGKRQFDQRWFKNDKRHFMEDNSYLICQ
jgi:hypothetical protein